MWSLWEKNNAPLVGDYGLLILAHGNFGGKIVIFDFFVKMAKISIFDFEAL